MSAKSAVPYVRSLRDPCRARHCRRSIGMYELKPWMLSLVITVVLPRVAGSTCYPLPIWGNGSSEQVHRLSGCTTTLSYVFSEVEYSCPIHISVHLSALRMEHYPERLC